MANCLLQYSAESVQSGTQPSQRREIPSIGQARQKWSITIEENPRVEIMRHPSEVSIFRVPGFLKESGKGEAYIPKRVSLGPYHNRSPELRLMNSDKGRALTRMMMRLSTSDPVDMEFCDLARQEISQMEEKIGEFCDLARQEISQLEEKIRKMYEEQIDCDADTLARMLSFDGCFILEILRTLGGEGFPGGSYIYEPIFEINKIDCTGFDILNDILMLENQVPLIVLRKLLELELKLELKSAVSVNKLLEVLVKGLSSKFYPFKYDMSVAPWEKPEKHVDHILGLLHSLIVYGPEGADQSHAPTVNDVERIPSAEVLRNAGIKFKHCDGGIKQIKFDPKSATMLLPPIHVTVHTEVLFRNLVAFELCKASEVNYVTCYVHLMDDLIGSEQDVAVLQKCGIVTSPLAKDEEVAELFIGLGKGVTVNRKYDFMKLKQQVNKHYKSSDIKVWAAEFVKEHFTSPWKFLALVGSIAVLLFTAVQTVFSVISIYK